MVRYFLINNENCSYGKKIGRETDSKPELNDGLPSTEVIYFSHEEGGAFH